MFQILNCSDVGTCCSDYALANFLNITRRVFEILQIIAPIILILMCIVELTQLSMNPDTKDGQKKIINKIMAAVSVFSIPIVLNSILGFMPSSFVISTCWTEGKRISEISKETSSKYIDINSKKPTKIVVKEDYENSKPASEDNSNNNSNNNSSSDTGSNLVETNGVLAWPAPGCTTISSTYGPRTAPTAGASTNHKGIDISCPQGSNVTAAYDGTVAEAKDGSNSDGYNGGRGYYILISHNINGQSLTTQYYHLSQPLVSEGSTVTKGQIIAKSGGDPSSAGAGTSTGSHLHFGVHDGTSNQNPCTYLGLTTCSGDVSSQLK